MRMAVIALILVLLGGCVIVPLDRYYEHRRPHTSPYYGPPGNDYEGYRYNRYHQGRTYDYRGDYGYSR